LEASGRFPDFGLTFGNPDFVKYAESYGARGWRVHATGGYSRRWSRPFSAGGVHVVAIPIDYSENMRVLVDELTNSVPTSACRSQRFQLTMRWGDAGEA
jgi:acetolactate synthase-1/2/3 large subunit